MKKIFLAIVSVIVSAGALAQTQKDPLQLNVGENSYTNTQFQNKTDVYYAYTNSSKTDQALVVTSETPSTTFTVRDGSETVTHSQQGSSQVFEVKKGETVQMEVESFSKTTTFTVAAVATDLTTDLLKLPSSGNDVYLPCKNGNTMTTYYKAEKSGELCISFYHAQTSYPAWKMLSTGASGSMGYENDFEGRKMYCAKLLVVEGEEYNISFSNGVPDLLDIWVDSADDGTSIDNPFKGGIDSTLVIPAAAGHYWFQLDRRQYIGHRYLMTKNAPSLEGGNVKVYASVTDTQPQYSVNGCMDMRMPVYTSDANYFVRIEKKVATAKAQSFQFTLSNEVIDEDSITTAPKVEAGKTYTLPHYNGTYYYTITIPSDITNKYLVVDGSEKGSNSAVQISTVSFPETYLAKSDNGYVRCVVTANKQYIITWKAQEGKNDFPFTVSYRDIVPGETADQPIYATADQEYTVPADEARYYVYTAQKECWIEVSTNDVEATVHFMKHGYTDISVACEKNENISRLRAAAGDAYLIVVTAADNDATLRIHETDRSQGESAELAFVINAGKTEMAESALDTWYVYTAPQSGMLRVQSDITYELDPMNPTKGSDVTVQNGLDGMAQSIISYDNDYNMIYDKEFSVKNGDMLYIHIKTYTAQGDKSITITMRDYEAGESPIKPRKLLVGDNTLPACNSLTGAVWYSMDLLAGDVVISQAEGKSFNIEMYTPEDTDTPIATTERSGDSGAYVYTLNYNVTSAGEYLFKLTNSMEGEVINVSAMVDGIEEFKSSRVQEFKSSKWFNVAGQRVDADAKGIVIMNGKKVVR